MSSVIVHTDCRLYRGSAPCGPHKHTGQRCDGCPHYDPIRERVLILKLAAVGDVLRTTSILPALKRRHPRSEITWVTRKNAEPLLVDNPMIDRVLTVEEGCIEHLLSETFDLGICLDADAQSAALHSIATCKARLGYHVDRAGRLQPVNAAAIPWWHMGVDDSLKRANRKTYQQIMYEMCDLPGPAAPPQLQIRPEYAQAGIQLRHSALATARKIVGINTGGGGRWQHKKWTTAGYIECIGALKQRFPDVGLLLLGGPEEEALNADILRHVRPLVVDGGCRNPLMQFAGLIAQVDVLLTSDSLAMHIGVALEKPTVVLVGPTSPWELDVFGKGKILHSNIDCLACYLSRCDKDPHCMNTLPVEAVVEAVAACLN